MEDEKRAQIELRQNADLTIMLQNMDVFQGNVSQAIRDQFPELFSLHQDEAKVELSSEETNALLDWLEMDLAPVIEYYKDAIEFLRTDDRAESEKQIEMMLELEKKIGTQEYYWNEKHRGKGFAYKLIKKLIAQK